MQTCAIISGWIDRLRGSALHRRHPLPVKFDKIDRIEQQGLKAAVADCCRDNLAREWEQQPRAFDHDERLQAVGRHIHNAEHAAKHQLEAVEYQALRLCLAFEPKGDLEVGFGGRRSFNIDLNVDVRLRTARRQRTGCMWILEREILEVLNENADLRHRHLRLGGAICRRHRDLRLYALRTARLANTRYADEQCRVRSPLRC